MALSVAVAGALAFAWGGSTPPAAVGEGRTGPGAGIGGDPAPAGHIPSGPRLAQQSTTYRLAATWRDMWSASRVVAGHDGHIYVLINFGANILQMDAAGSFLRQTPSAGLSEIEVGPSGDLYAVRDLNIVRLSAAGGDVWSDRIHGESHPRVPGGERKPYLQSVAWDPARAGVSLLFDRDETYLRDYDPGGAAAAGPPLAFPLHAYGDLAYDAMGRVYLLNRAANTIEVYVNGAITAAHVLPAPTERFALGPNGSVFALVDRRWIYQVRLDPVEVIDVWSAVDPEPGTSPSTVVDLAADASGRVYVADAGRSQVRVYSSQPGEPNIDVPAPLAPGCQILVDKTASPNYLWLGERTKVTLDLRGQCLDVAERADIVLVVDRSDSMNYEDGAKIAAARQAVLTFVALMDLTRDQVALASFASDSRIDVSLTHDRARLNTAAQALTAGDGTDIASGLDRALEALRGPDRRADAKPIVVLMSDGVPFDTSRLRAVAAGDRLRHADIPISNELNDPRVTLYTVGLGQDVDPDLLKLLARTPELYFYAPKAGDLDQVYRNIARRITASVLLKEVTIVDHVPNNMTYIRDSAVPAANWDAARRTLTWQFTAVPFAGTSMTYWLQPQQVGQWPTNMRADYSGTDGLDQPQAGPFPVPHVVVVSPTTTPSATVTPPLTATPTSTPTRTATAAPTRTPTASATATGLSTHTPSPTRTATPVPPTRTATVMPSPTPDRYTIYVIVAFNGSCFKRYVDVVLVLDASTTMLRPAPGGRIKLDEAKDATRAFLDQLQLEPDNKGRHDQAAIVWFNDTSGVAQSLTNDRASLDAALAGIRPVEGSRINLGLESGHLELVRGSRPAPGRLPGNAPVMVLLSDGIPNRTSVEAIVAAADDAKNSGVTVYGVGYGGDVNEPLMRRVASQPEQYFFAPSGDDLTRIYRSIAGEIVCR